MAFFNLIVILHLHFSEILACSIAYQILQTIKMPE